jgi:hypothetical protein
MSITLAGISLPDLVIEDEYAQAGVRSVVEFSLGGRPIIWEDLRYGKTIDLVGTGDTGWIDRSTLEQLQSIANIPLQEFTLDYEGELKSVRFRQEDPPVISATPILPRPNHVDGDWYANVRIKLMEV